MKEGAKNKETTVKERDPLEHFLKDWIAALFVFATISCLGCVTPKTGPGPAQASKIGPPSNLGEWVLIRDNPPSYWPRWLPRDYPADAESGEWVMARNSLFFVPDDVPVGSRASRNELIEKALAMRTEKEKFKETARDAGDVALVITAPANPVAWFSGCSP